MSRGPFTMPSLGADMESGLLLHWNLKPGDRVERGDIVGVVETAKGAIDIECFEPGVFERLLVEPGTEVPVGTALAMMLYDRDVPEAQASSDRHAGDESAPSNESAQPRDPSAPATGMGDRETGPSASTPEARPRAPIPIVPRARKRAQELGVDIATLTGTGPDGVITTHDVEQAAQRSDSNVSPAPTRMQDAIAAAMAKANREIPHYYLMHTVDVQDALAGLEARNANLPPASRVLPAALWIRATALALAQFPMFCGWFKDGRFVPSPGCHIGVAISLRDGGLVNPALQHADRLDLAGVMDQLKALTQRARAGSMRASELSQGAITITSLGDTGVDALLPIIHPPQVAIIGFGGVVARPWVKGSSIAIRRVVEVSLAADHRVSNGHGGARFLRRIAQCIETAEVLR